MSENSVPVTVLILDKEYRVACKQGEEDSLIATARFVDKKMREIRSSGKVLGTDRIAVMTALNLAHELLEGQSQKDSVGTNISHRLHAMQEKIDAALSKENQLDL
ncbi:MAG: cell division protein ZapA [Sedimenticola sp.]|nr:cell division protein ZapA [Sedimenticola sp.]MDF1529519.1 cell division protein ZapA [Sedimenticola sp.]